MGTNSTKLHRIRELLAQEFLLALQTKEVYTDKEGVPIMIDGKPLRKSHSPAMLTAAAKFLKDNGIDRDPIDGDYEGKPVVEDLPFTEPDQLTGTPQHLLTDSSEVNGEDL
ncbi:MAG: hypothetical protein ACRCZI_05370 [Cetobacterium sp.]